MRFCKNEPVSGVGSANLPSYPSGISILEIKPFTDAELIFVKPNPEMDV